MFTKAQAEAYFLAEKQESLFFIIIGIAALLAGILFLVWLKTPFFKGMAIPLMAVGLLQLIVGYTVYERSDRQRKDIVYKMDMDPDALQSHELPRMEKVMQNFVWYRYTEIALLLIGLGMIAAFRNDPSRSFLFGIAIGLSLQAAITLAADLVAEKRGDTYLNGMKQFLKGSHE